MNKKLVRLVALTVAMLMFAGVALADIATFHLTITPAATLDVEVEPEEEATEAPAEETAAPAEEAEAPAGENEAPAPAESEPVEEEPAEATETDLTAEETEAPAEETEAPAEETAAPAEATPAPVSVTAAPAAQVTEEPAAAAITYERDENGNLVLNANGNPVAIVPDGMDIPVRFLMDENGNLVLDENGDPIVVETVPAGSVVVAELSDVLDPERHIDVYASWGPRRLRFGDTATLIAVLYGYDNAVYTLQWQYSKNQSDWYDVGGATASSMQVLVTEDNYLNYWRIKVNITGVTE